jgi:chemotaxis protein MotB
MPIRKRTTRRSSTRGCTRLRVALAIPLLLGAFSCVSKGTYRATVEERDSLAEKNARIEEQLQAIESANDELASKLSEREQEVAALRGTYDSLVSDLEAEVASGHVQIEQLRDGIRVDVSDEILFPSGSAEFDDHGREVLKKVAAQIANLPHKVEVEGHTDDVAIVGALAQRYPTNWELAGARAAQVVRFFQDEGIDGSRMRAISNAEFDPAASNDEPKGRQRNRRIGIRLVPAG